MSLYGALFSGVSGLVAQSSAMGAISDNITNVSTIGYKGTSVQFQTLVTKQTSATFYSAGGVQSRPRQATDIQGLLQASTSQTDFSISGGGFFVVNEAAQPTSADQFLYTRAGSFIQDNSGFLKNTSGFYLQGWPVNSNGVIILPHDSAATATNQNIISTDYLETINLNRVGGTASATSTIAIGANLPSNDTTGATHKTDVQFFDSLGNANNLSIVYAKTSTANQWDILIEPPSKVSVITLYDQDGGSSATDVYQSIGQLEFLVNPAVGDTVIIGSTTFEFGSGTGIRQIITTTLGGGIDVTDVIQITVNGTAISFTTATTSDTDAATGIAAAINANTTVNKSVLATTNGADVIITSRTTGVATLTAVSSWTTDAGGDNTNADVATAAGVAGNLQVTISGTIAASVSNLLALIQTSEDFDVSTGSHQAALKTGSTTTIFLTGGPAASVNDFTVDPSGLTTGIANQTVAFTVHEKNSTSAGLIFDSSGLPSILNVVETEILGFTNGAADMDGGLSPNQPRIVMDFGTAGQANGMTQFGTEFTPVFITQDGSRFGTFAGLSLSEDGMMTALFDNGETRKIFQIPLATFVNPNQLENRSGNVWNATEASGDYTLREADSGPGGATVQAALEASTVDIGEEFTNMIVVQRAYSASTKIISTADEMLEELMRVKR